MIGVTKTVSVVILVYFNAESLPILFDEITAIEKELLQRGVVLELIFVNDGSGDNSLQELLKIKGRRPATKIISLSRNFGGIAAWKTGLKYVTGDAFVLLSADLQDPPDQILAMADEWLAGNKFVICTRASRKDPLSTRVLAALYYRVVRWMIAADYPRGGFDLMLMDKIMLPYMASANKHTNPSLYAYWLGFRPVILPYNRRERRHGRSRWTFAKKLKLFIDTISGFSVVPIRLLSLFGIIVALASFLYGARLVVLTLLGHVEVRGFATLAVLISFFSGLILVMLGVIGEYLWRVFDAVNNKPESVIDETYL